MTKSDKYALITGASSGIGEAFARHAAINGYDLGLCARRKDRLLELAGKLQQDHNVAVDTFCADLGLPGAGLNLFKQVQKLGRKVNILINNAGISIACSFAKTTYEQQLRFLELTINTPVALSHAVLPHMTKQGWGRILNISSIAALSSGGKGHTLYPAGKAFLLKFSQSLAAEVSEQGVLVSAVLPGFVATEFQQANNIDPKSMQSAKWFTQRPEQMVEEAWRRNNQGAEIIVPGLSAKIMAVLLRYLPEKMVRAITRPLAEEAYVGD